MARQARKELADLRAMEEENARMAMHGSGKRFVGAGATPSMGLSQFRGGKKMHYADDEDEMEGGRIAGLPSLITNVSRLRPPTALVPYRPPTALVPRAPPTTSTDLIATRFSTPSMPPSFYQNLGRRPVVPRAPPVAPRPAPRAPVGAPRAPVSGAVGSTLASRISQALSLGIPLAMLGSYLSDQGTASGDAGYYDDFAGEEFGPSGEDYAGPTTGPSDLPMDGPMGGPMGGPMSGVPSDLSPAELAWYLQSGNLPDRYALRQKVGKLSRRGKGKLEITHGDESGSDEEEHKGGRRMARREAPKKADGRSARAEIVRRVMRERGVKLAEASSIVKREGLY